VPQRVEQDPAGPIAAWAAEVAVPGHSLPTIEQWGRWRRSSLSLPLVRRSAALGAKGATGAGHPTEPHGGAVGQVDRLLVALDELPDAAEFDPLAAVGAPPILASENPRSSHRAP